MFLAVAPCLPAGRYPAELRGLQRAAKLAKYNFLSKNPRIIQGNPKFAA
jgi:hypothetical protein